MTVYDRLAKHGGWVRELGFEPQTHFTEVPLRSPIQFQVLQGYTGIGPESVFGVSESSSLGASVSGEALLGCGCVIPGR